MRDHNNCRRRDRRREAIEMIRRGLREGERCLNRIRKGLEEICRGEICNGVHSLECGIRGLSAALRCIAEGEAILHSIGCCEGTGCIREGLCLCQKGLCECVRSLADIRRCCKEEGIRRIKEGICRIEEGLKLICEGLRCVE